MVPRHPLIAALRSFSVAALVWPTLPGDGRQAIAGTWSESGRAGFGLMLNDAGELELRLGSMVLRSGQKHAWLEIALDEGRNRQIRRLLKAFDVAALRLLRVRVGKLALGELPKGQWRALTDQEIDMLAPAGT